MRRRADSWASGKAIDELSARETEVCEQLLIVFFVDRIEKFKRRLLDTFVLPNPLHVAEQFVFADS